MFTGEEKEVIRLQNITMTVPNLRTDPDLDPDPDLSLYSLSFVSDSSRFS